MTRRYGDQVEVRRRDQDPSEFLWHDRLYVVRSVLSHWVETGSWWQAAATSGSSAFALDSAALAAEREVWRVEATSGRLHGTGVHDLSFDWAATGGSGWTLLRTMD
jgi:hypothetical protein